MGIGNPSGLIPRTAPFATGTPDELLEMGEDLREVFSCAIPSVDANKRAIIRGCPRAGTCAKFFKDKRLGGFAPKNTQPGTPGQGPENVPFSIETAEGDYMESYMPCHVFLGGPYGRMMAARNPEANTGEKIHVLGKAGEAKIMVSTTLPKSPKSLTDMTLVTTNDVIVVPKHPRPQELDPRWKVKRARMEAEAEEAVDDVLGESVGAHMPEGDAGAAQAAVESIPVRKKGA